MFRWVRRALLVVALVVLVGGILLALTARPDLENARDDVNARWRDLRPALNQRYELLEAANQAVSQAGGPERDVVRSINVALQRWQIDRQAAVEAQVDDANTLEALGRRLVTTVQSSTRFGDPAVATPVNAYANATAPEPARAFNRAVREYEDARGGSLRRPVAAIMGFDSIPSYDIPVPATTQTTTPA